MSQKRQQLEEGAYIDEKRPRKSSPSFKSAVLDVMTVRRLQHLMEPVLEPLIRRVVKEEVDSALRKYIISRTRNSGKDLPSSGLRSLRLLFLNTISVPVFTGGRIEGEGGPNLEVALVDTVTGQVVSCGLGSSAKVEIVALEGDFEGSDGEHWTVQEFRNNIVRERQGKKPLLTGDVVLSLKNGKGSVGDILFTDNSSWTRSRRFRLGARVLDDIGGMRVIEARSEPFIVRDHRGELYKKHYPPYLGDEVWRLEKIGKDGAFHKRLRKESVNTVKEFLMLLILDPTRLRNILGSGMSAKMWEVTVEHARTCVLDKKLYFYEASRSQHKNGVVFNVVGEVMGMFSNDRYVPDENLSEAEKATARELVIHALGDRANIVTLDDDLSKNMPSSSSSSNTKSPSELLSEVYNQDPNAEKLILSQQNPEIMQSVGGLTDMEDYFPADIRYYDQTQTLNFPDKVSANFICSTDSISPSLAARSQHSPYMGMDYSIESPDLDLLSDLQEALNTLIPCSVAVPMVKACRGWNVLISVLKWWFAIKRIVARKTRGRRDISKRYQF